MTVVRKMFNIIAVILYHRAAWVFATQAVLKYLDGVKTQTFD